MSRLMRKLLFASIFGCGVVMFTLDFYLRHSQTTTSGKYFGDSAKNIQEIKRSRHVLRTNNDRINVSSNLHSEKPVKIGILIVGSVADRSTPVNEFIGILKDGLENLHVTKESYFIYKVYVGLHKYDDIFRGYYSIHNFLNSTEVVVVEEKSGVKIINALAKKAYDDGMEFLVKVDVGTKMSGNAWTSACVRMLMDFKHPLVGVVGATCVNCQSEVITQYMVHRTHLDIFYDFFPPHFSEGWADDWISTVYEPNSKVVLNEWQVAVRSTLIQDNRENSELEEKAEMVSLEIRDRARVEDHISAWPLLPRVVSFSLYGSNPRYTVGAIENMALMPLVFPGWQMWIYHDKTVPTEILREVNRPRYVKLIPIVTKQKGSKMSWRFRVATDTNVECFIIRDIDSRLSKRDKAAVDEWLASGKSFHIVRDHPSHSVHPMQGGMWGGTNTAITEITKLLGQKDNFTEAHLWLMGSLNTHIWPLAQKSVLQHDAFSCERFGGGKAWPIPRDGLEHVGSVYVEGKMRVEDTAKLEAAVEPIQCVYVPFKIIVIAESCNECLQMLLQSIQLTDYQGKEVHVEIGVIDQKSSPNIDIIKTAKAFKFNQGTESFRLYNMISDIHIAWLEAWTPASDDQRAIILTEDLRLSPLWFRWMSKAWHFYKNQSNIGAISLSDQTLIASTGNYIEFKNDEPFLYRMASPWGFSPSAKHWKSFIKEAKRYQNEDTSLLAGKVAAEWLQNTTGHWIQIWLRWSWTDKKLYTLYVCPSDGYLVSKWNGQEYTPRLAKQSDNILITFPQHLERYGWDYTSENRNITEKIDRQVKPFLVWSNDFHLATIGNVKSILAPMKVKFIDKSLASNCKSAKTCGKDLKVLNHKNGYTPSDDERRRFQEAYKDDPVIANVDIFMCFHPSAMCELFMPFKKRMFVIATTRYEIGRWDVPAWQLWNENLKIISKNSANVVAGNNLYDAEYIRYFTGIDTIVLPSVVIMNDKYNPISEDIVVHDMRSDHRDKMINMLKSVSSRFRDAHEKYGHYSYKQLCENTAVIHIPYQLSIMSLFEQYAMGIPIIAPSRELLWELHDKYEIVRERTWERTNTGRRPFRSPLPGVNMSIPDPNNDYDKSAFMYWSNFSDYYRFKHVVLFNSFEELPTILSNTDWKQVSRNMLEDHAEQVVHMREVWKCLLYTLNWRACYTGS